MITVSCNKLYGKVTSVAHSSKSCRVTIELSGTPEMTAGIMKESIVELGIEQGQEVCAEIHPTRICVGIGGDRP